VDGVSWKQKRAQLLLKLHRFDEARDLYLELLKRNPEQFGWHAGLQAAQLRISVPTERWLTSNVTPAVEATLRELYDDLQQRFPRAQACKRLPLDFARDPAYFSSTFNEYAQPFVRKGVPSLFADLKPLCEPGSPSRVAVGELLAGWLASLEGAGTFPGSSEREPPSTIMWVRVLAAQYYDCCGEASQALEQINFAIKHTPTCLDLYLFKARVYKHAGDARAAARWMDEARKMDLADRYLNTKATRYLLRADQVTQADSTIALFTKDGDTGSNLLDMQCMWYEFECGASYLRMSDYGRALKNFMHVEKHFNDFAEDQFDFHTYCIRKMTLRAYISMIRLEDSLFGHKFYVTAACGIVETYMRIVSNPQTDSVAADETGDGVSASERKKQESKRRKAEAKAKAEADAQAKKEVDARGAPKGKKGPPAKEKPPDEDPDGKALAQVEAPLEKAAVYMRTLLLHAPAELRVQVLASQLAMARCKWLLALQALRKALGIAIDDPRVHRCVVRFFHATKAPAAALPAPVAKVIALHEEKLGFARHSSLAALNEAYLSRNQSSPAAHLAYAEMLALISPDAAAKARETVLSLDLASASLAVCKEGAQLLAVGGALADSAAAAQFRERALARYPHATAFGGGAGDDVLGRDDAQPLA
jgi:peptide alpha-N-acetyltransferase